MVNLCLLQSNIVECQYGNMVETAQIFVAQTVTSQVDVTRFQENASEVVNQDGLETCVIRVRIKTTL